MPLEQQHVAIKILNPVGYKLIASGPLKRCIVAIKGVPLALEIQDGLKPMTASNVWWLVHPNTKQVVAAFEDPRLGGIRELPLPKCVEIWGWNPPSLNTNDPTEGCTEVKVLGCVVSIPRVPKKFAKFIQSRRSIYREISNMSQLDAHPNVLALNEVLELVQDTKSTIFLVLELATGGELFDRIKIDCGTEEATARTYFQQLLRGVAHCHKVMRAGTLAVLVVLCYLSCFTL